MACFDDHSAKLSRFVLSTKTGEGFSEFLDSLGDGNFDFHSEGGTAEVSMCDRRNHNYAITKCLQ